MSVLLALVKLCLTAALVKQLKNSFSLAVITNDIYTQEDEALMRMQILPADRDCVETGGCPHTAIREDASINLAAVAKLQDRILS